MQSLANAQVGVLFASATHLRTAICAALAHDADVIVVCLDEEGVPVDDTQTVPIMLIQDTNILDKGANGPVRPLAGARITLVATIDPNAGASNANDCAYRSVA
jgi:hypothetical protein